MYKDRYNLLGMASFTGIIFLLKVLLGMVPAVIAGLYFNQGMWLEGSAVLLIPFTSITAFIWSVRKMF